MKNKKETIIGISISVVVIFLVLFTMGGKNKEETVTEEPISEEFTNNVDEGALNPDVQPDGLVHPKAPGEWMPLAVRNFLPKTFVVGENTITGSVGGGMWFEANMGLKIYDELNLVLETNIMTADGSNWMTTDHVPMSPKVVVIPENLKGKILIVRFLQDDVDGDGITKYWGTTVKVE